MKHTLRTFFMLVSALALFGTTACKNASDSSGESGGVAPWTAVLTLSSDKPVIKVKVTTADNSSVTVTGCKKTTLASGEEKDLNATGTKVTLTGKITELNCDGDKLTALDVQGGLIALQNLSCNGNELTVLNVRGCTALASLRCESNKLTALNVQDCTALRWLSCSHNRLTDLTVENLTALTMLSCAENQLTALNVQGCSVLEYLDCYSNKLAADAFTKLLTALPAHTGSALCTLYTEKTGAVEGNRKDFTNPPDLKAAFEKAKTEKKWTLKKYEGDGTSVEI